MLQSDPKTDQLRSAIRSFVLEQLETRGVTDLKNDASLIEAGVIDSLGIFQFIAFLENTFQIRILDHEIVLSNFETIDAAVHFVARKLSPA